VNERKWNLSENRDIEGALQCAASQVRVALRVTSDDPSRAVAHRHYEKLMSEIHVAITAVRIADEADASTEALNV
jgi:hypothetical protein